MLACRGWERTGYVSVEGKAEGIQTGCLVVCDNEPLVVRRPCGRGTLDALVEVCQNADELLQRVVGDRGATPPALHQLGRRRLGRRLQPMAQVREPAVVQLLGSRLCVQPEPGTSPQPWLTGQVRTCRQC